MAPRRAGSLEPLAMDDAGITARQPARLIDGEERQPYQANQQCDNEIERRGQDEQQPQNDISGRGRATHLPPCAK